MNDNKRLPPAIVGAQIRKLRLARGLSLAEAARRAGTSAPALHRYESGWDRFEVDTLRRIAAALGARLEIRLVEEKALPRRPGPERKPEPKNLLRTLASLFWDKRLVLRDLEEYPLWVMARTLMYGDEKQVRAARGFYGDEILARSLALRVVDEKTRNFWNEVLGTVRR